MENTMSKRKSTFSVKNIALTGLLSAVICVLSPFALHIPFSPVPISLGMLAIYFVISVAGMKLGTISVLIYILLGLAGVPVFTDFTAGPGKLLGPTGGYIIGYIFLALIGGFFTDRFGKRLPLCIPGLILGTCVCYLFGTLWLQYQLQITFFQALLQAVIPYIPVDLIKLILAVALGFQIRKRLMRAGLLTQPV